MNKILKNLSFCFLLLTTSLIVLCGCAKKHQHNYQKEVISPTCLNEGYTIYKCECGDSYKDDVVKALGHDLEHFERLEPTCSTSGHEAYDKCKRCDYTTFKTLDTLSHTPSDWIIDQNPTCTKEGSKHKECTTCKRVLEEEIIAKTKHDVEHFDEVLPTCTKSGHNAYDKCKNCSYTTYEELPATGHKYEDTWSYDDEYHFHKPICGDTTEVKDKGLHELDGDGYCSICHNQIEVKPKFTITYNANGGLFSNGEALIQKEIKEGNHFEQIELPTKDGYVFHGWWLSSGEIEGTKVLYQEIDMENDLVSEDLEIFAEWVEKPKVDHQLEAPKVYIDGNTFTWNQIPESTGYHIMIYRLNPTTKIVDENITSTTYTIPDTYQEGYYQIQIRANGNGYNTVNSAYVSKLLGLRILGRVKSINFDMSTSVVSWDEVEDATSYQIYLGNSFICETTNTSYDMSNYDAGNYTIKIRPIKDKYYSESSSYSFIKRRLLTPKVEYKIMKSNDNLMYYLYWDKVEGASIYKITINNEEYDVNNTFYNLHLNGKFNDGVTTLNVTISAFDETGNYLISRESATIVINKLVEINITNKLNLNVLKSTGNLLVLDNGKYIECATTENDSFYVALNSILKLNVLDNYPYVFKEFKINDLVITDQEYDLTIEDIKYQIEVIYEDNSVFDDFLWKKENDDVIIYGLKDLTKAIITIPEGVTKIDNSLPESNFNQIFILEIYNKSDLDLTTAKYNFLTKDAINIYTTTSGEQMVRETSDFYYYEQDDIPVLIHYKNYQDEMILPNQIDNKDYIIGKNLFAGKNLTKVTISSNVIEIGEEAFRRFHGMIVWKDNPKVKVLGIKAFDSASGINEFIIPSSVEEIKDNCFSGSTYEKISFEVGSKLKKIGNSAFGSTPIKSIVLPSMIMEIGDYVFSDCKNLEDITIPKSVIIIKRAFTGCTALKNVYYKSTIDDWLRLIYHSLMQRDSLYVNPMMYAENLYVTNDDTTFTQPTSVIITNDITTIKKGMLLLKGVTSITVSDNVTAFDEEAFYGCNDLQELTLPFIGLTLTDTSNDNYFLFGRLFSKKEALGLTKVTQDDLSNEGSPLQYDFFIPTSLTKITITSLNAIPKGAFNNCTTITNFNYSNNITSIGTNAFKNSGIREFVLPLSVTNFTFLETDEMPNLNKVYLHSLLRKTWNPNITWSNEGSMTVPNYEIYYDGSLEQFLNIENNVKYSTVLYVKDDNNQYIKLFDQTKIIIKEGVTALNRYFAKDFTNLTEITLPKSLKSIEAYCFNNCPNLKTVYYNGSFENWQNLNLDFKNIENFFTLNENGNYEALTHIVVNSDNSSIKDEKFINWTFIKEVTIKEGVSNIGTKAFYGCVNLEKVNLPSSLTIIGTSAFEGCINLREINLSEGLKEIYSYAFKDCKSLTKLVVPKSVYKISTSILSGCSSLEELEITYFNNAHNSEYAYPFGYLFGTTEYVGGKLTTQTYKVKNGNTIKDETYKCYIPEVLRKIKVTAQEYIPHGAFSNMSMVTEIELNQQLSIIGKGIFEGCTSLEKVTLPFINYDRTSQEAKYSFALMFGTTSLEKTYSVGYESLKYYLPTSLKTVVLNLSYDIPAYAFSNCKEITTIDFATNTTNIGEYAFRNCTGLTSFNVPTEVTTISQGTFYGCTNLETITFKSPCTICEEAFTKCTGLKSIYTAGGMYFKENSITDVNATNLYIDGPSSYNVFNNGSESINESIFMKVENIYVKDENDNYIIPTELTIEQGSLMENQIYGLKIKKLIITDNCYDIALGGLAGIRDLESLTIPMVGLDYLYDTTPDNTEFRTYFGIIFGSTPYENSLPDYTDEVKTMAFYIPKTLKEVIVMGGEYIAEGAFRGISSITNVILPSTIVAVGKDAFTGTSFLYNA